MKKEYKVVSYSRLEICVPSDSYYAKSNDWYNYAIHEMRIHAFYDTEEQALNFIEETLNGDYGVDHLTFEIIPVYRKKS